MAPYRIFVTSPSKWHFGPGMLSCLAWSLPGACRAFLPLFLKTQSPAVLLDGISQNVHPWVLGRSSLAWRAGFSAGFWEWRAGDAPTGLHPGGRRVRTGDVSTERGGKPAAPGFNPG